MVTLSSEWVSGRDEALAVYPLVQAKPFYGGESHWLQYGS
jgi:hypothetical protein